jgi:hypothetical protein
MAGPQLDLLRHPEWRDLKFHAIPGKRERDRGVKPQMIKESASHIRGKVAFSTQREAPLLQLADACAFGLRRFFAEQQLGKQFARHISGEDLMLEEWKTPWSGGLFYSDQVQHSLSAQRLANVFIDLWNRQK